MGKKFRSITSCRCQEAVAKEVQHLRIRQRYTMDKVTPAYNHLFIYATGTSALLVSTTIFQDAFSCVLIVQSH